MDLTPNDPVSPEFGGHDERLPRMGDWYWVKRIQEWDTKEHKKGEVFEWLGCVMKVGSNFVELHSPNGAQSYTTRRVHIDQIDDVLRFEPNPETHITAQIQYWKERADTLMREVQDLHHSLGVRSTLAISDQEAQSTALATLNGQQDIKAYEGALIAAKKEKLPKLFEEIKHAQSEMARWMQATLMPLQAQVAPLKEKIGEIDARIFNISLYAGLTEHVELITPGAAPAAIEEKLHVMQRRQYMDEMSLLNYEAGGMEFEDIHDFDKWIAKPDIRNRLLPFQRTLVAFRVRRHDKERDDGGHLVEAVNNIYLRIADKFTYLYIRNGDQIWRLSSEMDFGTLIFPDATHLEPGQPMMVKMFAGRPKDLMTQSKFEYLLKLWHEKDEERVAWNKANPGQEIHNPHGGFLGVGDRRVDGVYFNPSEWAPVDHSNVHYDEIVGGLNKQIQEFNRVAVLIQGLFDRSEVLHPHKPVKSWTEEGFQEAISLVYDGTATLYQGDRPDFEAYRTRLNATLKVGSVISGAEDYWERREAIKECAKIDKDWRSDRRTYRPKRFRPYGDPGPGLLAVVVSRTKTSVTVAWERDGRSRDSYGTTIPVRMQIPISEIFNVSEYTPGDYLQFYQDPRTRADYMQWASLMLCAEDFHAGKRTTGSKQHRF